MPILGARGAASAKGFGWTGNSRRTAATYWLANQGGGSAFRNIVTGNAVLTTSYTTLPFRKYSPTGSITNSTEITGFSGLQFTALDADTSNSGLTSYACFVQISNSPSIYNAAIVVNNSLGNRVTTATRLTNYYSAYGVTSDGSFGYCSVNNLANTTPSVFRYTLANGAAGITGGVQISDITNVFKMCTGPSGEVYATFNNTATSRTGVISLGTNLTTLSVVNWAVYVSSTAGAQNMGVAFLDGYVYFAQYNGSNCEVLKLDASDGSLVAKRVLYYGSVTVTGCAAYNNVLYVSGYDPRPMLTKAVIWAFSISGSTLSYLGARTYTNSTQSTSATSVTANADGLYVAVEQSSVYSLLKLPLSITSLDVNGTFVNEYNKTQTITIDNTTVYEWFFSSGSAGFSPTLTALALPTAVTDSSTQAAASTALTAFYVIQ